jgi:hypothetical protein
MRLLFGLALIFLLSASVAKAPDSHSFVRFRPILLDRDRPERRDFDQLTLLGAWRLTSNNPHFGGISSMRVANGRVLALSDAAYVFQFPLEDRPVEEPLRVRPLPEIYTARVPDRDSESMTSDPESGDMWVGFEASNTIRRFSPNLGAKRAWAAPVGMARWPDNTGAEGMARLPDGRFLVFSEAAPGPNDSAEALVFPGDPTVYAATSTRFYYKPPKGFSATDAANLPDGRVLVLNRHFSIFDGVAAALTIIDPRDIAPERIVPSRLVAMLKPPLNMDNMEALSVEQQDGRTILWIASDDNFNPLQQTLLMKFALKTAPQR